MQMGNHQFFRRSQLCYRRNGTAEQFLKGPTYLISICEIGITYCVVVRPYEMPPFSQKIGLHSLFLGCCEYHLVVCKTPYSPTTTMVFLVFSDAALLR